jgi:hypothetical protein
MTRLMRNKGYENYKSTDHSRLVIADSIRNPVLSEVNMTTAISDTLASSGLALPFW